MLQLKNIVKQYTAGSMKVDALKGINIDFRKNEFVSVLGPSGCGKTTLLNIIGGLDRYTSGDLIVNETSTKQYRDVDWDIYRNNSIGFVFQNYNLISHQTVLANVELAMTLAGISRAQRHKRAIEALQKVGLGDQIHKKPNQMSGGQMQRVAIARALVNNPDILLADEPTGALDSETSVQIMEILKEISKERLIIMVTHNPELAKEYSTRIIKLLDGNVLDDTNPYTMISQEQDQKAQKRKRKKSMSFFTALSLSLNNLMTKKARTFLTAFAGSIGIIGIALILSLSSGMQAYINNMQADTLSTYPIEITRQSADLTAMMTSMQNFQDIDRESRDENMVYSNNFVSDRLRTRANETTTNDLGHFKKYLESTQGERIVDLTNDIQYKYDTQLHIYKSDGEEAIQVNPSESGASNSMANTMTVMIGMSEVWSQMIDNRAMLENQYDVLAGDWPSQYNEIVLVVNENNEISDSTLYSLAIMDPKEFEEIQEKAEKGEDIDEIEVREFSYEELMDFTYKVVLNTDYYEKEDELWIDKSDDKLYMEQVLDDALELKIVGIIRPNAEVTATSINGAIGYMPELTEYIIDNINKSEIVREQRADDETNVFTGLPFDMDDYTDDMTMEDVQEYLSTLSEQEQAQMMPMIEMMSEEEAIEAVTKRMKEEAGVTTYEENLLRLGSVDIDDPSAISIYPMDYDAKEMISGYIEEYNREQEEAGNLEYVISYSDIMELMMSSVTSIVNIITYVLIAFVAISLVVSSIMIGIITYISVLERTKEIGILRSIGASKRDISTVFNAETFIVGFVAGALGIVITLLLNIPISMIIASVVGVSGISTLPVYGAVALVIISVILTIIAGLFPSKIAAKKDPVEALRTE